MKKEIGLYVHIPFCVRKCAYCDFASFAGREQDEETYVNTVLWEAEKRSQIDASIATLYFGGGTPSLLPPALMEKLLTGIRNCFDFLSDAECSCECNPGTVAPAFLDTLRRNGVNRLSFGAQAAQPHLLSLLGRIHTWEQAEESVRLARQAGFENINLDLMLGLPTQTLSDVRETLEKALIKEKENPAAVYITTPDYLGNLVDVKALAAVCHRHGVPLLVDNAHGAYLKFLPQNLHPLILGADLCCDSAHKTLPVLTGGAYLHISKTAPSLFAENADRAMALFASTSPSYLILQSLDACNAYLDSGYRGHLATLIHQLNSLKTQLTAHGYSLIGDEPTKLTLAPKSYGYTGDELHDLLRVHNMECEFSDPDFLTLMFTPDTTDEALHHLQSVLLDVPRKAAISVQAPPLPHPERVLSIRDAMLSPGVEITVEEAEGRIFADAHVGCPPCIPIIAAGERIDQNAVRCFRYYGIKTCQVIP